MPNIWQQISSREPETYIDGYGTIREVYTPKIIRLARKIYNVSDRFFNGKDNNLSEEAYKQKHGYNKPIGGNVPLLNISEVNPKYVTEFSLNIDKINAEIQSGKSEAIKYLKSSAKKNTDAHNAALAKRKFGYNLSSIKNPENRVAVNPKLEIIADKTREGGYVVRQNVNVPSNDEMMINLAHDVENTAFHENLHRGFVGTSIYKPDYKFYNWKNEKLLRPNHRSIFSDPEETAVHLLETGRKHNLLDVEYPGSKAAIQVFKDIGKKDPASNAVLSNTKWDTKPKRVWDALQGKYMVTIPAILAGTTFNNE